MNTGQLKDARTELTKALQKLAQAEGWINARRITSYHEPTEEMRQNVIGCRNAVEYWAVRVKELETAASQVQVAR